MHFSLPYVNVIFLSIATLISSTPVPEKIRPGIAPRGGSSSAHTCLKNQGSGFVCNSQTSISACNTAVNNVCNTANNAATVNKLSGYNNVSSDCFAGVTIPSNYHVSYPDCVAAFQDIMADCVAPNGTGFSQTKQGGSRNIHFNDNSAGNAVDNKLPAFTIGASKCMGGGPAVVIIPSPGGVSLAPRKDNVQLGDGDTPPAGQAGMKA